MASARTVSRSVRRWSSLGVLPFIAVVALAACGGKVVVDAETGEGGAGGTSVTSASVTPSSGSVGVSVCDAGFALLDACIPGDRGDPADDRLRGQILCQMTCVVGTSCEALGGMDIDGAIVFANCVEGCG